MKTGNRIDHVIERLHDLAKEQCGPFLDSLPNHRAMQLRERADQTLQTSLRKTPMVDAISISIWVANAVRISLEDLLDGLIDCSQPESVPGEVSSNDQGLGGTLRDLRAAHRAIGGWGEPERTAWLLFYYLGCSLPECVELLGDKGSSSQDVSSAVRMGLDQAKKAALFEGRLLQEAELLSSGVWKAIPSGPIPSDLIALVRDAVRVRLSWAKMFPADPDRHILQTYYLAFGDLYRSPRKAACNFILDERSATTETLQLRDLLGLDNLAKDELAALVNAGRARLALRREDEYTKGQDPIADNWFAMMRDAELTAGEVAAIVGERVETVVDTVRRYEQAIWKWIDNHPDGYPSG